MHRLSLLACLLFSLCTWCPADTLAAPAPATYTSPQGTFLVRRLPPTVSKITGRNGKSPCILYRLEPNSQAYAEVLRFSMPDFPAANHNFPDNL